MVQDDFTVDPVDDLTFDLDSYRDKNYLTHNYHPYPAKFVPQIPRQLIRKLTSPNHLVIDPFCGCGTTLVECKLLGRRSIGIDINPLACLISRTKMRVLSDDELAEIRLALSEISRRVTALYDSTLSTDVSQVVVDLPEFTNRAHWFKDFISRELAVAKSVIDEEHSDGVRDFLMVAFSSIITAVSNQDSETRYVAVEKELTPLITIRLLAARATDMMKRMREFRAKASDCASVVHMHDSRNLSFLDSGIVDLVITSPPYLNCYDYYLYHKHRMQWFGMDYRTAQEGEIGSRHKHSDKDEGVDQYQGKIGDVVKETSRLLKSGGYFCVIVGDGIKDGTLVRANQIIDDIATECELKKAREITFDQRKYTKTFTKNLKTAQKNSYILVYKKRS